MNSVDRKFNIPFAESTYLKIEPALWITFIFIPFCIACSPDAVIIIGVSCNFR